MRALLVAVALVLFSGYSHAMRWAYVDASFGNCAVPQWCTVIRVETQLHALSAIGRDPFQSRALPGALGYELRDAASELIDRWEQEGGVDAGVDHLVYGFSNDFWTGAGDNAIAEMLSVINDYAIRSPRTVVWVLDYPPAFGAPDWVQSALSLVDYEGFRKRYRESAERAGAFVLQPYEQWLASFAYHPNLPGPDYHLSQHSAIDAALAIYLELRKYEQRSLIQSVLE